MEADIILFDEVDSTNTVLKRMADDGAKEGTCVIALSQRKGQGRYGRTFYSPHGNLYMSLLLRPEDDKLFEMITVIAGVAAAEAINEFYKIPVGIKWVNDIIVNEKKAGGIVAQSYDIGKSSRYVILGIGINIYEAEDVPDEIRDIYTSLTGAHNKVSGSKEIESFARTIIRSFSRYYDSGLIKEAVGRYRQLSCVIGKMVEYVSGSGTIQARVCGISDDGGLIVETPGGKKCFRDGEIRIRQALSP
ncbi:MAG: biotin--[Lachnospiraceae bacterium]|nr:biotin--[acetyl-CoA-carboxylase] ligase [Lachnospiraceae bacterium]